MLDCNVGKLDTEHASDQITGTDRNNSLEKPARTWKGLKVLVVLPQPVFT